jgi:hypothetical protein
VGFMKRRHPLLLACLLVALAAVVFSFAPMKRSPVLVAAAWGALVWIACIGLGRLLDAVLGVRSAYALTGAKGLAILLALGGPIVATGTLTPQRAHVLVLAGVLSFAWFLLRSRRLNAKVAAGIRFTKAKPWTVVLSSVPLLLGLAAFLSSVLDDAYSAYDDFDAYMPFIKQLLDTGSTLNPFSYRRAASYGGQTFLQALLLAKVEVQHLHVLDRGIAFGAVHMLIASLRTRTLRPHVLVRVAASVFVATADTLSINSAAHGTGLWLFLGLFGCLVLLEERGSWRELIPVSLTAIGLCALRHTFIPVAATMIVFVLLRAAKRSQATTVLREGLTVLGFTLVGLLPWMFALHRSAGAYIFPLQRGFLREALGPQSRLMDLSDRIQFVWDCIAFRAPLMAWPLLLGAALAVCKPFWSATFRGVAVATLGGFLVISLSFTVADPFSINRYAYPFVETAIVASMLAISHGRSSLTLPHRDAETKAKYVLLLLLPLAGVQCGSSRAISLLTTLPHRLETTGFQPGKSVAYARAQGAVPEGAVVAVVVDQPFWLDFKRNTILNLDIPGAMSPPPHMPFFQGSEALRAYLLQQGITHVMCTNPKVSVPYGQAEWTSLLFSDSEQFRLRAAYYLDLNASLAILGTDATVYNSDDLSIIRLQR